ncbi:hypothetical protein U3516DRAFT_753676 [Neocallimastix sp. 'constans']
MVILLKKSTLSIHSESMFNPFFTMVQLQLILRFMSPPILIHMTTNSYYIYTGISINGILIKGKLDEDILYSFVPGIRVNNNFNFILSLTTYILWHHPECIIKNSDHASILKDDFNCSNFALQNILYPFRNWFVLSISCSNVLRNRRDTSCCIDYAIFNTLILYIKFSSMLVDDFPFF